MELTDQQRQLLLWWRPRPTLAEDVGDPYSDQGLEFFGWYLAADGRPDYGNLLLFCRRWRGELEHAMAGDDRDQQILRFLAGGDYAAAWPSAAEILVQDETGGLRPAEFRDGDPSGIAEPDGHVSDEAARGLYHLALEILDEHTHYYRAFAEAVAHWRAQLLSDPRWRAHALDLAEATPAVAAVEPVWLGSQENGVPVIPAEAVSGECLAAVESFNGYVQGVYNYCSYYQTPVLDQLDGDACRRLLLLIENHQDGTLDTLCRELRRWLSETVEPYQQRLSPGTSTVEVSVVFEAIRSGETLSRASLTGISYAELPGKLAELGMADIYDGVKQGVGHLRGRSAMPEMTHGHVGISVRYVAERKQITVTVRLLDTIVDAVATANAAVLDELADRTTTCYFLQAGSLIALSQYAAGFGPDPLAFAVLRITANSHHDAAAGFVLPAAGTDVGEIERVVRGFGRDQFRIVGPKAGYGVGDGVQRLVQQRFPKNLVTVADQ